MKKKIIAILLTCSMITVTLGGCASSAKKTDNTTLPDESVSEDTASGHSNESGKDETVYVIADADGNPEKTIVSTWLKNSDGANTLSDISTLSNLTKVKGEGSYTEMEDGTIRWDANGNDVYYQGTSSDSLPVETEIHFELDGKNVSAKQLDGASGHLTLSIDYINHTAHSTSINGTSWTIYQPYMLISTLMFDNEKVRNVKVENGEAVNSGENTIVVGIGMPGLQESLGLNLLEDGDGNTIDDIEIPDHVVIDADIQDFSLSTILTVATGNALENLNLDDVDSIDKLRDSMDELADGMADLLEGTQELYDAVWGDLSDGIDDLKDGTQKLYDGVWGELAEGLDNLKNGVKALDEGAGTLKEGAKSLSDGASTLYDGTITIDDGMSSLLSGLQTLSSSAATLDSNSDTLVSAGALIVDTLFSSATTQLNDAFEASDIDYTVATITHSNYESALNALTNAVSGINLDSITEKVKAQVTEQVTQQVESQTDAITEAVTASVKEQVAEQVTASVRAQVTEQVKAQLSAENPEAEIDEDTLNSYVDAQMASSEVQTTIDSTIEAQMASDNIQSTIQSNVDAQKQILIEQNVASAMASDTVKSSIENALGSVSGLNSTIAQLYQVGAFYDGLVTYTNGVGQLSDAVSSNSDLLSGASDLKSGTSSLRSGAKSLADGTDKLYDGSKDLKDGTKELKDAVYGDLNDGISSLKDGTKELNDSVKGELYDGITDLKDGVKELNDGVIKLDEEGIQKIINLSEKDLENVYDRLEAVKRYSDEMTAFGGSMPNVDTTTKYVFRTAAIGD